MSKSQAKEKIKKLVAKYENLKKAKMIKAYNEANTRKNFIMPLFDTLGWDIHGDEVTEEEKISKGRVDYAFRIDNIPKFFLEAKPLKADLEDPKYTKQTINYAYNKDVTWAVLTDFEGLKIFNAGERNPKPINFTYQEYLTRFNDFWLLSKEAFQKGLLDEFALKWGIKREKIPVGKQLAQDLITWRKKLTSNFKAYNKAKYSDEDIDEAVQRFLDRLIFIRVCEDKEIEPKILRPLLHDYQNREKSIDLMHELSKIFRKFDSWYNSSLFAKHFSEKLETDNTALEDLIEGLYGTKDGEIEYDFSAIDADVLGNVYQQYLGTVQQKGEKKDSKRKKQGIYYTPTYIVDYIVQNTLGEVLKEKSLQEVKKLKILDPACGSGSFLIKAFDVLDRYLGEKGHYHVDFARRAEILINNIYGVDLDPKAVEIAQLNLLLQATQKRTQLPTLNHNIRCGNSLVSGTEKELKKYFGKNWQEQKPFNWQEEFKEVFNQGGFDIIIGNPPYISITGIDLKMRHIFKQIFKATVGRFDIFMLFIERSINLLKTGGLLGFIIPNKFLTNNQSKKLREFILDNGSIIAILKSSEQVFSSANVNNVVLIFEKIKIKDKKCKIFELKNNRINQIGEVLNKNFVIDSEKRFIISQGLNYTNILGKTLENTIKLEKIADVRDGIVAGRIKDILFKKKKINNNFKPLLFGNDINRYVKNFSNNYVDYRINVMKKFEVERIEHGGIGLRMRYKELYERPKILTRKTADRIIATFDNDNFYYEQTLHSTYIKDKSYNPLYILALLNSNLYKFYYQKIVSQSGTLFPQVRISFLKNLPVKNVDNKKQKVLVQYAKEILNLNTELQKVSENTNKYTQLKQEIEKLDQKIDQEVYKLYGLTNKEIKIVEQSVNN